MAGDDLTSGLFRLRFKALGTQCEVQFRTDAVEAAKEFRAAALGWIKVFEDTWSRFKPESLLSEINAKAGKEAIELSEEQEAILWLCDRTFRGTGGLVDPTSLPLTLLWDEGARRNRIPSDGEVAAALEKVSWPTVEWGKGSVFLPRKGMALEIGGFGKEHAVDVLMTLAARHDISDVLVDLGRDLAARGEPPHGSLWVVGVEDAREEDAPAIRLAFSGKALATSGNGRRFREIGGERFGHIIDPRDGRPVENNLLTATCLADDCLTAGWYATSACILGPDAGLEQIERHLGLDGILQTVADMRYSQTVHRYVLKN